MFKCFPNVELAGVKVNDIFKEKVRSYVSLIENTEIKEIIFDHDGVELSITRGNNMFFVDTTKLICLD